MAGKIEQVEDRGKEAIWGSLTGNKDVHAEGKADRRAPGVQREGRPRKGQGRRGNREGGATELDEVIDRTDGHCAIRTNHLASWRRRPTLATRRPAVTFGGGEPSHGKGTAITPIRVHVSPTTAKAAPPSSMRLLG